MDDHVLQCGETLIRDSNLLEYPSSHFLHLPINVNITHNQLFGAPARREVLLCLFFRWSS